MSRFGLVVVGATVCFLLLGVGFAGAARQTKVVQVSRCVGSNAEPEQAIEGQFVYEAWIGCQGIGFARSVNGGRKFGPSRIIGNGHLLDPAVAVAPNGTVYVSYMTGTEVSTPSGTIAEMVPAVAVSSNHGRSFAPGIDLPVPTPTDTNGNWGDRDFIAVGPDGTVYVTWDYGPSEAEVKTLCDPSGGCAFSNGDFNAVIQKSTDGGKTWTMPTEVSAGFPLGGVYSAPIVAEPDGTLDVLYVQHPTDLTTLAVSPGGYAPNAAEIQVFENEARELLGGSLARAGGEVGAVHVDAVLREGPSPARALIEEAESHNAELLVVGPRGLSGLREAIVGSVSHACCQHAGCPVLVVPTAERLHQTATDAESSTLSA
jgi:nucleotide-binding universal stress UspA family protein